jgi:hypothetical protein
VALIKKLKYYLLSISQMIDENLEILFKKNECKVLDSSEKIEFKGSFGTQEFHKNQFNFTGKM